MNPRKEVHEVDDEKIIMMSEFRRDEVMDDFYQMKLSQRNEVMDDFYQMK
jgi:hypothetical protein